MVTGVPVIAFDNERAARLLVSYLRSQQIQARYHFQKGQFEHAVVLESSEQLEQAKAIAEDFIHHPNDEKYQQSAWDQGEVVNLRSANKTGLNINWAATRQIPFTALILLICSIVYGASIFGGFTTLYGVLKMQPLSVLSESGEWWRLIGPIFLHFSALHLIFNLLWWWMLGGQIERRFGTSTLIILLVVSAIISNVGQLLYAGSNFGGLSGVVYAVVGFVWWCGWLRPQWGVSISKPMVGFLLFWLLLGYADVLWVSMANMAHTLGLVVGCLSAWLLTKFEVKKGVN